MSEAPKFSVSEFLAACNQVLDFSFSSIIIEGEISSFKVNQGKWVFFDLKDEESSLNCFMTAFQMRMPLEDGMKVLVRGTPKVTKWGKFSLTVQTVVPVGEGNIKKSYEILKAKLAKEGLFDPSKKRPLPAGLSKIGVISSTAAAGYADFIKIINERWGGFHIQVAHTQVQGVDAPDQIIRALKYFNEHSEVELIAIIRGGGSADDLAAFNDEQLVRAIAASKIPVITGIGHEVDESLSDLAADLRGSTPSNVAELISPDKHQIIEHYQTIISRLGHTIVDKINNLIDSNRLALSSTKKNLLLKINNILTIISSKKQTLDVLNPEKILQQGYAILKGKISPGNHIEITTKHQIIAAEVTNVKTRNN